ncbi:MAG: tRNA (adenosine(37)-N6)-dimethylallyltransferase MiaA [Gemmatimonadaceae bacterium]
MDDVRLRVIVGPTAAGKSALALTLAAEFGAAVISADSRQIYRGFDIGTAKPSPDEQARAPHFGVDVVAATERFSAAQFAALALAATAQCSAAAQPAVVVGGTGFYVRALVQPLFREPAPPLALTQRTALAGYLATLDTERLREWCATLDAARSHLGRTQLLRAIEVALLTGKRLSAHFRDSPAVAPLPARYLLVDPEVAPLEAAITRRVDEMLARGWVAEVERLVADVPPAAPAWLATGYAVMRRYVQGDIALDSARLDVITATRQYAKRQRTWFRHQLRGPVTRLNPNEPGALDRARAWWRGES